MKKTKILFTMLLLSVMILPNSLSYAAENTDNNEKVIFMEELSEAIKESNILDEKDYSFKLSDVSASETCFQWDSVEEIVKYLEMLETNKTYTGSSVIKTSIGSNDNSFMSQNIMGSRGSITKNISYTWSLTSAYTLTADVYMNSSTHSVTGISNPFFYLHGVTLGIGITDISYETVILDMGETAFVKAKYTHISYLTTPIGSVEISRERCKRYFYYSYDAVYSAGFNYI